MARLCFAETAVSASFRVSVCILGDQEIIFKGNMNRQTLDGMSYEQLRAEARRYCLQVPETREALIDSLMTHMERNSPMVDMLQPAQEETVREEARQPVPSDPIEDTLSQPGYAATLSQILTTLTSFAQQQQLILQQLTRLTAQAQAEPSVRPGNKVSASPDAVASAASSRPAQDEGSFVYERQRPATINAVQPANAVTLLALQIPEFSGADEENVRVWTQRVDRVAQIHRAPDDVVLLAASSKLTKAARRWYDMESGTALESWNSLREEIVKIFDRKLPYYMSIQCIEAKKWNPAKESFDQYALDKLVLMQRLKLPTSDAINLLISGITKGSLRATALALSAVMVDEFLTKMRRVTEGITDLDKKPIQ